MRKMADGRTPRLTFPLAVLMMAAFMLTSSFDALLAEAPSKVSQFKLKNGMQVVVIPDTRAPVVTHMVWYRVGAADEPPGVSGIAHFLEHLMFKSTKKIKSGEFSKSIAKMGGQDNAFTSQDATAYFQRIAKSRLGKVMEMEADRMVNLQLTEKEVLTERNVILEERRSRTDNNPSSILDEQMDATLYANHPYRIPVIGWAHEMATLSQKDALDFYKRHYAPNNAILVVAGDVNAQTVRKLAQATYGKIARNSAIDPRKRPREPGQAVARRIELKDPRAGKASLRRYYLVPSYMTAEPGEAEALDLLAKIAFSGSTSRLYRALVVKGKQAASAGGWYGGSGLDSGKLAIYAVAADGVALDKVEAAMDKVVDEIQKGGVTALELKRAKKLYLADYIYESDSQQQLARRYGWGLVVGRSIDDIQSWPDRISKVTAADVLKVAKKYIDLRRSVTGRLLPSKAEDKTKAAAKGGRSDKS